MSDVIKVGIGVIALRDGKLLLGHRVPRGDDTGGIYEPDTWCLPGGKQEYGETVLEGAAREVKEETGLDVKGLEVFGVSDDIQPHKHFVTIQVTAKECFGEARAAEPDKQDKWEWFALDALPEKLYSPSAKFIYEYIRRMENK